MKHKRVLSVLLICLVTLSLFGCQLSDAVQKAQESLEQVLLPTYLTDLFPDAVSYRETAIEKADGPYGNGKFGSTYLESADAVLGANGAVLGYVIVAENHNAYNPPMTLALGLSPDGTTVGILFLELNETPGKGSLANEPAFKDQFKDRADDSFLLNINVDAISGATVTSKAVINTVNAGLAYFRAVIHP